MDVLPTPQAPPAPPPSHESQIATLNSLLLTLDRTRSSLPSLLRSFQLPTATPLERATVYRAASNECWSSIRTLGEELDKAEGVLTRAEQSRAEDAYGIKEVGVREKKGAEGWERLVAILGSGGKDAKGKGKETQDEDDGRRRFAPPREPKDLEEMVGKWSERYRKVTLKLDGKDGEEHPAAELTLKGVMRAVVLLHWSDRDDGQPGRTVQVERVACFGLKEDKPVYMQSQFSLFNGLNKTAMQRIEEAAVRREKAGTDASDVEEILIFLSNPPLPF